MARTWVVLAHLVVFLVLVSESSAPTDHLSKSKDGKFDNQNPSSTEGIRSLHSNNSTLDGFTSEEKTVDFDLEGLGKSNITGITSTTNASSSFIDSVSLNASPQSWLDDPSTWTITSFLALWGLLSIVIGVIAICYYLGFLRNRRKSSKRPKICDGRLPNFISFSEIQAATNRFHRSKVIFDYSPGFILYEGHLPYHGRVMIKRWVMIKRCGQDKIYPREFQRWKQGISHKNIVAIRGWSEANDEFVLVYEHMSQTLHELLTNDRDNIKKFHTWEVRVSVIQSVAYALEYLHDHQIVYNNLRSCRIFLDWNLKVKLGNLGHSLLLKKGTSCDSPTSSPPPTLEHDAYKNGISCDSTTLSPPPTLKHDVYNFGVILFEVLTGRGHFHNKQSNIVDMISDLWARNILLEASDIRLVGNYPSDKMEKLLKVGLWCVHPNPDERPTISSVLQMIVGSRYITDPPRGKRLSEILVEPEQLHIQVEPRLIKLKQTEPEIDHKVLENLKTDQDMVEFHDSLPHTSTT